MSIRIPLIVSVILIAAMLAWSLWETGLDWWPLEFWGAEPQRHAGLTMGMLSFFLLATLLSGRWALRGLGRDDERERLPAA